MILVKNEAAVHLNTESPRRLRLKLVVVVNSGRSGGENLQNMS